MSCLKLKSVVLFRKILVNLVLSRNFKNLASDLSVTNEIYGKNVNEFVEKSDFQENLAEESNETTIMNGRLKGKFVNKNF